VGPTGIVGLFVFHFPQLLRARGRSIIRSAHGVD